MVVVAKKGAQAVGRRRLIDPGLARDVAESATALVPIQDIFGPGETGWSSKDQNPLPHAAPGRNALGRKVQVLGHVEIEITVPVVVAEASSRAPARQIDAGGLADVAEPARALVPVQDIGAVIGHVEVEVAVPVVVGHRAAHAPTRIADPGRAGIVLKGAVAQVAVEGVGRGRGRVGRAFQPRAVDQVDVEPTVAVVVEKRAPAAFGFNDVVFDLPAGTHLKVKSGGLGHFGKERGSRRGGRRVAGR